MLVRDFSGTISAKIGLKVGGGESNEESGGSPEKGSVGYYMGPIVAEGKVSGERVAKGLNYGSEKGERSQAGWISVKGLSDFFVNSGQ